jgi:NAD(P)-dependent dehydrogenase (short-subunit alcohol dehydrogenase family)
MGRSFALRLAQDGFAIAVVDIAGDAARRTSGEILEAGAVAGVFAADLGRVAEIDPLVERIENELGPIEVLVNNAAVVKTQALLDVTGQDWDLIMGVNAKGLFFLLQAVGRRMAARGRGSIVNIASVAARSARPKQTVYGASKAAVLHLTKSTAAALGPSGVRVNAVCPGVIETPMWQQVKQERTPDEVRGILASIPLGRTGGPEEVAEVVAFLASDRSSYINGQGINVCGGLEMD